MSVSFNLEYKLADINVKIGNMISIHDRMREEQFLCHHMRQIQHLPVHLQVRAWVPRQGAGLMKNEIVQRNIVEGQCSMNV